MSLTLYNTLGKQKEPFVPIEKGKVGLYSCGPTVYSYVHIGNLRAYITADILRRALTYHGYEVRHIKNITDVGHLTEDDIAQGDAGEDKMIKKARAEKKSPAEIARFYETYAKQAEEKMNILPAHYFPRATEHIPQMIAIAEKLIAAGHAYETNGNVFLDVTTVDDYGSLSGNTLEKLKVGARLEDPHPDKRNQWDFALWLKAPKEHLMQWDSPWGRGYPGWHIECSAMSTEYLGETFDIHTGGEDNIFPHHEAEIAQTECATGKKPYVRYWVHARHLLVDGTKMSKSKGNLYTIEDIEAKGFSTMDLRLLFLLSHYRSQMNFTWDALHQAQQNRKSLQQFASRLETYEAPEGADKAATADLIQKHTAAFEAALDDDLNTPQAIAVLLQLASEGNTLMDQKALGAPERLQKAFGRLTEALGLLLPTEAAPLPPEIQALADQRAAARAEKDFAKADTLRDELQENGYSVEDTADGQKVEKV